MIDNIKQYWCWVEIVQTMCYQMIIKSKQKYLEIWNNITVVKRKLNYIQAVVNDVLKTY